MENIWLQTIFFIDRHLVFLNFFKKKEKYRPADKIFLPIVIDYR
jgi:hypothetical protein